MKKLSLLELHKQLKEDEKIPLEKFKEVIGGAYAGCCHGYCQECSSDTYETSADDNRANANYS